LKITNCFDDSPPPRRQIFQRRHANTTYPEKAESVTILLRYSRQTHNKQSEQSYAELESCKGFGEAGLAQTLLRVANILSKPTMKNPGSKPLHQNQTFNNTQPANITPSETVPSLFGGTVSEGVMFHHHRDP